MKISVQGEGGLPVRGSSHAAGSDLVSAQDALIKPGERVLISTGIRMAIPSGFVGLIWPRSGLACREGVDTMAGVIDSDYRGEVKVLLINHGYEEVLIRSGDRLAQILIQKVEAPEFIRTESLPESERGSGGFGSTGDGAE